MDEEVAEEEEEVGEEVVVVEEEEEEDRTQTAARRELVERALLSSPPSVLAGYGFVTRVFPALRRSPLPRLFVRSFVRSCNAFYHVRDTRLFKSRGPPFFHRLVFRKIEGKRDAKFR